MKKLTQASHVLKNGYFCEAAVAQGQVDIAETCDGTNLRVLK